MRILVAGSSGFLGSRLVDHLRGHGHEVVRLVRREPAATDESGWDPYTGRVDRDQVEAADVVVNLAGSPTAGNPHSRSWARNLRESRVTTTSVLAEAVAASERRPAFLAGNAVGWYGDHGSEPVDDGAQSRGDSLMTVVSRAWHDAAGPAAAAGARVCWLRTAPVMHREASPLRQMRLAWRAGLGARVGDGRQFFPLVSLPDWLGGVRFLAEHEEASGPFALCCPQTPTNAEFTDALARAVGRRARLRVPNAVVRVGAGRLSPELLGSLNLRPRRLEELGYSFADRDVDGVLDAALQRG